MPNTEKLVTTVLGWLNPDKSAGKTLMVLNALGIGFAAASNTFAAATDKNTSAEDKKFLVPAGAVTGLANLGIYFGMTNKLVDYLEGDVADKVTSKMINNDTFTKGVEKFVASYLTNIPVAKVIMHKKVGKKVEIQNNWFEKII